MKMYLGLDVHGKKTVYVAMDQDGQVIGEGAVETSRQGFGEMSLKLGLKSGTPVGLESGSQAFFVARTLFELGLHPSVINAHEVRAKAQRRHQKCDRRDAYEICDGLRQGIYRSLVYVPPPEIERLRQILSRRRHFVKVSTMQINAARFLLRTRAIKIACSLTSWAGWEKLLDSRLVEEFKGHLQLHAQMWKLAQENIAQLEEELEQACRPFTEQLKLLMTAPGVGLITAATFLAAVGDPSRFANSAKLASYIGLVPSSYDSGDRVRHGHITRAGSPGLRAVLCEAAHQAGRIQHPLHPYWCRLMARSGYRRAVTAVAHRMARILYRMWRDGETFDVRKLNVELKPGLKIKPVIYRIKRTG